MPGEVRLPRHLDLGCIATRLEVTLILVPPDGPMQEAAGSRKGGGVPRERAGDPATTELVDVQGPTRGVQGAWHGAVPAVTAHEVDAIALPVQR